MEDAEREQRGLELLGLSGSPDGIIPPELPVLHLGTVVLSIGETSTTMSVEPGILDAASDPSTTLTLRHKYCASFIR
jgi:hypothetical protein